MFRAYLQHLKDEVLEAIIEQVVLDKLEPFGHLLGCEVNTHDNCISAEIVLRGDSLPILVAIERYEVIEENDTHFLELRRFSASKEWLQAALDCFLVGRRFRLPTGAALVI